MNLANSIIGDKTTSTAGLTYILGLLSKKIPKRPWSSGLVILEGCFSLIRMKKAYNKLNYLINQSEKCWVS